MEVDHRPLRPPPLLRNHLLQTGQHRPMEVKKGKVASNEAYRLWTCQSCAIGTRPDAEDL